MTQYKTCTKCGQTKPFEAFGLRRNKPNSRCRQCVNEYTKQWNKANPEKAKKHQDDYNQKNPGLRSVWNYNWRIANKDHRADYLKSYRAENKDLIAAKTKAKRLLNLDAERQKARDYQKQNPELFRTNSAKRRAVLKSSDVRIVTHAEVTYLLSQPCFYCGAPSEHIDHIVPLSRGGRHSIGNLTGACKSCNLSKGAKFITEWKRGKIGH